MKNFIKNKEMSTNGQLHHNPGLEGLTTHDKSKISNPIKSKHRYINRHDDHDPS